MHQFIETSVVLWQKKKDWTEFHAGERMVENRKIPVEMSALENATIAIRSY